MPAAATFCSRFPGVEMKNADENFNKRLDEDAVTDDIANSCQR